MTTADWAKMWARIQEGLLDLIDHATALQQMMDRNPIAAINPARKAMSEALDRRIASARKEIQELEKGDVPVRQGASPCRARGDSAHTEIQSYLKFKKTSLLRHNRTAVWAGKPPVRAITLRPLGHLLRRNSLQTFACTHLLFTSCGIVRPNP